MGARNAQGAELFSRIRDVPSKQILLSLLLFDGHRAFIYTEMGNFVETGRM